MKSAGWISVFALIFFAGSALAARSTSPIVLQRADVLRSHTEGGRQWQELIGHVWMTQDSFSVTCDEAQYYADSGLVFFHRNVECKDPQRILLANEVVYREWTGALDATGDVRIYQDTLSVTCDRARYLEGRREAFLYQNVRVKEENRRLLLTGQEGYLNEVEHYARATIKPVLTERDSLGAVRTEIRGDTVEYFGQTKIARVLGHVEIDRGKLVATADELDYARERDEAVLTGNPQACHEQDEITGDTLTLQFHDEELKEVFVLGHAVAISPADSLSDDRWNRMEGKKMTLWIENEQLKEVLVEGTARATYYIREDDRPRGTNETSGDRLRLFIEKGQVSRVQVVGGTEGRYTPERFVGKYK
jgi:lipopolysaccharide assembly outer membrane protein LptD (OstA)